MPSRKLQFDLVANTQGFHRAFSQVDTTLKGTAKRVAGIGAAAVGFSGLAAGAVSALRATVEFDKSMRNVNSIAQLSERQLGSLEKQVLKLAGKTAQAPDTLAKGLYDLVSSGFNAHQSMEILGASAKAATAGLTTTETSTAAVAAVLNAYHLKARDAGVVSDTLFQTVNRGVVSFEELASTIGDVLPFASSLHVGLGQVGAAISTMTKEGISAPETMTRIKSVMEAFIKPSEGMAAAIKATGAESGEALVKQKGLQGALEALLKTTDGSKESVAKLFPNIRALGGALALTGGNARTAHTDLAAFRDVSGATDKALSQQAKSVSFQWQKLKSQLTAVGIEVGTKVLPAMSDTVKSLSGFVHGMTQGTGAGGRFVDEMRPMARALGSIAHFLGDHPQLIAAAVVAWGSYKAAGVAAAAVTRGKILASFVGLGPRAAAGGAQAGTAFGTAASTTASTRMRRFGWGGLGTGIGGALGTAAGIAMAGEVAVQFNQWLKRQSWYKPPGGKGGFFDSLIPDSFLPKIPKHPGGLLGALGVGKEHPPNRSHQTLRPATTLGKLPGHAAGGLIPGEGRGDTVPALLEPGEFVIRRRVVEHFGPTFFSSLNRQRFQTGGLVRAHAARAGGTYSAPELADLWVRAGGDRRTADLMAAIALAESGGNASIVNSIGATGLWQIHPGGSRYLNPMANARTAVMKLRTQGLDAWEAYTNGSYRQFLGRSAAGVDVGVDGVTRRRAAPRPLTARIGHTLAAVPKHMGARLPKLSRADRAYDKGAFTATPTATQQQIEELTADPETNQRARNMRRLQIGVRVNRIDEALRSGQARTPATRQRLLDERTSLVSELAQLAEPIAAPTGLDAIPGASAYLASLDKDAALAALTPDRGDDVDVAKRRQTAAEGVLDYEQSHGFSDTDVAQAARDVKSARDELAQLVEKSDSIIDALKANADELKRRNDVAESVMAITGREAIRAVADFINGELGNQTALRGLTPGDGRSWRY